MTLYMNLCLCGIGHNLQLLGCFLAILPFSNYVYIIAPFGCHGSRVISSADSEIDGLTGLTSISGFESWFC